jgi:large subunit ribosomal protein L23
VSTSPYTIVDQPLITERGSVLQGKERPQYLFKVAKWANRIQIAQAIEAIYKVKVYSVNTIVMKGKRKRLGRTVGYKTDWKKAFVTLEEGQTLEAI